MSNALASSILTTNYTNKTLYLGLHTADPTVTGNSATELAGGGYVRLSIVFGAPSNRSVVNNASITFTNLPATTITHFAIWSAQSGGAIQHTIAAGSGIVVSAGGTVLVPVGDIAVTLN